ncbi:hypothetical protein BDR26DRAFT_189289 [Obelidium mucronatum]|nr:hypothetical protein BDR26DRAFT_189289 [Obelidium mucronatum]
MVESSDPTLQQSADADEWEDCPLADDEYIVLDVNGFSAESIKEAARSHNGVSLIGLDSPEPMLRIGNMHFKGAFDTSIGSDIIFATSSNAGGQVSAKDMAPAPLRYGLANAILNAQKSANTKENPSTLTYMGHTNTHITFSRIRLEPKVLSGQSTNVGTPDVSQPDASSSSSSQSIQ